MEQIINLVIWILMFVLFAYGAKWACTEFSLAPPFLWICGVILLICILIFAAKLINGGGIPIIFNIR